jgi:hypothetical protein
MAYAARVGGVRGVRGHHPHQKAPAGDDDEE